jgi:hypothetical protein
MPFGDIDAWRRELLATADLVQYGDDSVPEEVAVRRFDRYVELADMVDGTEGPLAVKALISSLWAEEDYGAHQAVYSALERFPALDLVRGTVFAAAELMAIPSDNSGQVLQLVTLLSDQEALDEFEAAFGRLEPGTREDLSSLIARHEDDEWLADERSLGRLRARRL